MLFRLRRKLAKAWFDRRCNEILETAPIPARPDDDLIVLSAVGNQDLLMYLVAIKSFMHYLDRGKVMLLVQDDCPEYTITLLKRHTNAFRIIRDGEVDMGRCQPGGTWERLVSIVRELDEHYVIQVDSDTVTMSEVTEVQDCVNANSSFMIGTWSNQNFDNSVTASDRAKKSSSQHVQMLSEQRLVLLPDADDLRYARGQSSFAGFARGSATFKTLETLSLSMESMLGIKKWREWGSESFASNYLVANAPNPQLLPYPKYAGFRPPKVTLADSCFLHFEGTYRFREGHYIDQARTMIAELRGG